MAFSLTFNMILDNNIRHLYSGRPVQMSYRHSTEYPNMDQLRQRRENQQLKDYVLKTSEYRSEYNCLIPKAPAYRLIPSEEVDEIVKRLQEPTVASTGQEGTSERGVVEDKEKSKPKYLGLKKVNREEMDQILERLNKPTKMSSLRERPPKNTGMPEVA